MTSATSGGDTRTVREAGESAVLAVLRGETVRGDGTGSAGGSAPAATPDGDLVGNGDDAAVLGPAAATVVTTDLLVEGTHFRLDLTGWEDVGRRAVVQNVSDVAAMGADCSRLLVGLCLPGGASMSDVARLAAGVHGEAARHGAVVVGGDVTSGPQLVLAVTAIGVLGPGEHPVRLDGGRPGDVLALTGTPGRSAAGLELMLAGHPRGPLQDAHRVPRLAPGAGPAARGAGARALTDVTDGLLRDLSGLARASGCAAELDAAALEPAEELVAAARTLGARDPRATAADWVLDGGEDHGLLAAFPPGTTPPPGFRRIGVLTAPAPGAAPGTVSVDGAARTPGGWDSARGAAGAH